MTQFSKDQYLNYLAIDLLAEMRNLNPTQSQINFMESLISTVAKEQQISFVKKLTNREISCLYCAAVGKSIHETAELLGIKQSTVKTYRKEIIRKLQCNNITHAVFEGMRVGYVK